MTAHTDVVHTSPNRYFVLYCEVLLYIISALTDVAIIAARSAASSASPKRSATGTTAMARSRAALTLSIVRDHWFYATIVVAYSQALLGVFSRYYRTHRTHAFHNLTRFMMMVVVLARLAQECACVPHPIAWRFGARVAVGSHVWAAVFGHDLRSPSLAVSHLPLAHVSSCVSR